MKSELLYFIEYEIPISTKVYSIKKYCERNKIIMDKTDVPSIFRFYSSEQSQLHTLKFQFWLSEVK